MLAPRPTRLHHPENLAAEEEEEEEPGGVRSLLALFRPSATRMPTS